MNINYIFPIATRRAASAALALTVSVSLTLGALVPVAADTKSKSASRALSEDQKIVHLLNRLGYGPRPGDVERVKRIGIDKYIDQQLHPERIDDSAVQSRLTWMESLGMPVADLYDKYPAPGEVARQLGLRAPEQANQQANPNQQSEQEKAGVANNAMEGDAAQREYRQKLTAYYSEKGLKLPQRLLLELQAHKIVRAVYSERQLQEVMSDFWYNHFNIFWGKGADRWLTTSFEMSAIRPNTMGKFKDLLLATAKSPAMLFYLDNFQSMSPDSQLPTRRGMGRGGQLQRRGRLLGQAASDQQPEQMSAEQRRAQAVNQLRNRKRGINENYAREIMELHTLGVDGGYTQKDVQEVARAFTGWTINQPRQNGSFIFREWMHDDGEKIVLGQKIAAGGGVKDGEKVIEILSRHPNTAKFIATKLSRRFVSDNPPASLVGRVAAVYLKTDGDIREMLRTIFTSEEFNSKDAYRAKIKSPFELAVSAIRALGGDTTGAFQIPQFIAKMGQPLYLYQAPTGFPDRADQWVNTGALLERLNFGLALSSNRLRGTSVNLKRVAADVDMADAQSVMQRAIAVLLNGEVSPQTRAVLDKQLREGVPVKGELDNTRAATNQAGEMVTDELLLGRIGGKGERKARRGEQQGRGIESGNAVAMTGADAEVTKIFGLVLGSPEFQRR